MFVLTENHICAFAIDSTVKKMTRTAPAHSDFFTGDPVGPEDIPKAGEGSRTDMKLRRRHRAHLGGVTRASGEARVARQNKDRPGRIARGSVE
jgi:hypothetical protein